MTRQDIRNVAIVAHVDHGKTTLVDQLLAQSGQFRKGQVAGECILDSNPLERERGITILAKNCAINYTARDTREYHINIVDTPGHADFSGEVERVLKMADGILLLVDAFEGVMPQTRYVLSKALAQGLKPIVVINKMDRPEIRPNEVINEVFDLLVELHANDNALDFPIVYASAKQGWASFDESRIPADNTGDIHDLFDMIIKHVPVPDLDASAPLQALITSLDYSEYVGRIGIGRVYAGTFNSSQPVSVIDSKGNLRSEKPQQIYRFDGLGRKEVSQIDVGDLFAVVGFAKVDIGDTITCPDNPVALDSVKVDEPTLHMTFRINDSPFVGQHGKFVTNRQLRERLTRELQSNVALKVDDRGDEFVVSGRGLLHLGILLENMRREGYELSVGKPEVIFHRNGSKITEPIEMLVIDVPNESVGAVMQLVGDKRAEIQKMEPRDKRTHLEFKIPARGLIGLRSRILTATQGEAIMHHRFMEYSDHRGAIPGRQNGVMIATEIGPVTAYAMELLSDRGIMFVKPGDMVYEGQIVGEHCRDNDIPVNATRKKALTNIRSANKEATVTLKTARTFTLEGALEYIEDNEYVEITPAAIRIRKKLLKESDRRRYQRKAKDS